MIKLLVEPMNKHKCHFEALESAQTSTRMYFKVRSVCMDNGPNQVNLSARN